MKLFVDIDNTIFNTLERQYQVLKKYLENHKNITVDCYNECLLSGNLNAIFYLDENTRSIHDLFRKSNKYYKNVESIQDGLSVINKISNTSFLSGRSINSKKATLEQLSVAGFPTNNVILRPRNVHYSEISKWKLEYLLTIATQTNDTIYMVDDDPYLFKLITNIKRNNLVPILFKRQTTNDIDAKNWVEISRMFDIT